MKRRYEENLARQQSQCGASAAPEGPVPIFSRLVEFTEEIEHEGEKIQVISPHKIRVQQLKNPPSSTQGNDENIHHWLTGKHESGLAQKQLTTYSSHSQTLFLLIRCLPTRFLIKQYNVSDSCLGGILVPDGRFRMIRFAPQRYTCKQNFCYTLRMWFVLWILQQFESSSRPFSYKRQELGQEMFIISQLWNKIS